MFFEVYEYLASAIAKQKKMTGCSFFNSGPSSRLLWYFGRLKHFDTRSAIYRRLWNQNIQIPDKTGVTFFCQLWTD